MKIRLLSLLLPLLFGVTACWSSSEPAAPPGEKLVLKVWHTETDKNAQANLRALASEFGRTHPGVTVEIDAQPWGATSDRLLAAMQSKSLPDIGQVQPFMMASLLNGNYLEPVDAVYESIRTEYKAAYPGSDIYPSVVEIGKDHALADGKESPQYGISYAIGVTGFAYDAKLAAARKLDAPETWADTLRFMGEMAQEGGGKTILPGADPFFMDQYFGELVANNGGRLFDGEHRPMLVSKEVLEVAAHVRAMRPYLHENWQQTKYLAQFEKFASREVGVVPVTYVRAINVLKEGADQNSYSIVRPAAGPSARGKRFATLDGEPWVIFRKSYLPDAERSRRRDLAEQFLKAYYTQKQYLSFCSTVPGHLTPVVKNDALLDKAVPEDMAKNWSSWIGYSRKALNDNEVRAILLPDGAQTMPRFLLEFSRENVLHRAMVSLLTEDRPVEDIMKEAQQKAQEIADRTR